MAPVKLRHLEGNFPKCPSLYYSFIYPGGVFHDDFSANGKYDK
jgi:hypothetical protein